MSLTPPTTAPLRTMSQTDFDNAVAARIAWDSVNVAELTALQASLTSLASGAAFTIPYSFSTTTTDSDPGAGSLRLDNATQASATTIRLDLLGSDAITYTSLIDSFDDSSSAVKGQIVLMKATDQTKWLAFNLMSIASPSGYKNITVVNIASSGSNPFSANDPLILKFSRTGDVGTAGTVTKRVSSITSSATPTPNATTDDMYVVTALATAPTFGAPTGSPSNGQPLMIRVKDNGTARALAFNTIYRASSDLALPSSTSVNKTLYMGFVYNSADTKWDLIAVLSNFS